MQLSRLAAEAVRVGLPAGLLEVDPTLRNLCSVLLDAQDLLAETDDTAGLPDAPD